MAKEKDMGEVLLGAVLLLLLFLGPLIWKYLTDYLGLWIAPWRGSLRKNSEEKLTQKLTSNSVAERLGAIATLVKQRADQWPQRTEALLTRVAKEDPDQRVREAAQALLNAAQYRDEKTKRSELDSEIIRTLERLCRAYASNDRAPIALLEPKATAIGESLHTRGGISEMRSVFYLIPPQQGRRTLEMHWGGIGDWRG